MNFMTLAERRYSCRAYDTRPVDRDLINRCLEAARLAPSACNSQPWSFVVVDEPPLRDQVASAAFSGLYRMNRFACKAPVLIVVMTERSRYAARLGGQFRGVQYSLMDVGIACDHLTLQAEELGLGTCWLGWFSEKGVKRALSLPKTSRIDVVISMGHPTEGNPRRPKKRKSIEEIVRYAGQPISGS